MRLFLLAIAMATTTAAAAEASKTKILHFGNEPWHLILSLSGLTPAEGFPGSPDRDVFTYTNDRLMNLSVVVENAHAPATLASCRDVFAQRKQGYDGITGVQLINEIEGQRGDAATQEYEVRLPNRAIHHNVFSCRARGTYYIDVHVSKLGYQPSDRDALMALMDAVTIVD